MTRRAASCLLAVSVLLLAPAAEARHKKPITKTFQVQNTVPYPVDGGMCDAAAHGRDRHVEEFRAPEAGELRIKVTGFYGDMDIVVTDASGALLAEGNNESTTSGANPGNGSTVETAKYKPRKAMALKIHVCNYAASPNATGEYTFTYAR